MQFTHIVLTQKKTPLLAYTKEEKVTFLPQDLCLNPDSENCCRFFAVNDGKKNTDIFVIVYIHEENVMIEQSPLTVHAFRINK